MNIFYIIFSIRLPIKSLFFVLLSTMSFLVEAEFTVELGSNLYYTDDVALFAASRSLSLNADPTQPIVDSPSQGADFVYEPSALLEWSGKNALGKINWSLSADGYVFTEQSAFDHGIFISELSQIFSTNTRVELGYHFIPDLYVGQYMFAENNAEQYDQDEIVTSQFWVVELEQPLNNKLTASLFGRYGLRNYNSPFEYRDSQFWTMGPKLNWIINTIAQLKLGYHYEIGITPDSTTFNDNLSYVTSYTAAELTIQILERLSSVLKVDYENQNYTSNNINDKQYGLAEDVYQGELELLYKLTKLSAIKLGWQYGSRKLNSEQMSIQNNNIWLGFAYSL